MATESQHTPGRPSSPPGSGAGGSAAPPTSWLARLDAWMAEHPWHPRVVPFLAYMLLLAVIEAARVRLPASYPLLYLLQAAVVLWLLWRYRRLLPELNLRFHPLAIPVGVGVLIAWVSLGLYVVHFRRAHEMGLVAFTAEIGRWALDPAPGHWLTHEQPRHFIQNMAPPLRALSAGLRLLGMSLVVPLVEELFIRSLMLRSLHRARATGIGLVQIASDLPVLGDWLLHTDLGRRAHRQPPVFGRQFLATPLGRLSVFGVAASTLIFALHHAPRDWAACVVCGVAYCLLLAATRRHGLGPTIWAHGLTNALLWGYTMWTGDWRFL